MSSPPTRAQHSTRFERLADDSESFAAGAGAPIAGLIVAFGDFDALSLAGAVGGALMFAALRLSGGEAREPAVRPS